MNNKLENIFNSFENGKINILTFIKEISSKKNSLNSQQEKKLNKIYSKNKEYKDYFLEILDIREFQKVSYIPSQKKFIGDLNIDYDREDLIDLDKSIIKEIKLDIKLKKDNLFEYILILKKKVKSNQIKNVMLSSFLALSFISPKETLNKDDILVNIEEENVSKSIEDLKEKIDKELKNPLVIGITDLKKYEETIESFPKEKIEKIYNKISTHKEYKKYRNKISLEEMSSFIHDAIQEKYHYKIKNLKEISLKIAKTAKEFNIDYKIFLSIIETESDFRQDAYNPSGDYSIAQINYKIWNKEFIRLKKDKLNYKLLKNDYKYSIEKMGEILSILKNRFKDDPLWYARYHSSTPSRKIAYNNKLKENINYLNKEEIIDLSTSLENFNNNFDKLEIEDFNLKSSISNTIYQINKISSI